MHGRDVPRTLAATALCTVFLAVVGVTSAPAARPASGETRAKMVRVTFKYAKSHSVYTSFVATQVRISSIDRHWGLVRVKAPDGNVVLAILKRSPTVWKVRDFGTAFDCASAPPAVLKELVNGCYDPA